MECLSPRPMAGASRETKSAPFIGRTAELSLLEEEFGRISRGGGRTVLVEGEAGIGKTRLFDEAILLAEPLGFKVLRGVAEQLEVGRPFGAFADALEIGRSDDAAHARIADLLYGAANSSDAPVGDAPGARYVLIEEILGLIERCTSDGPVALIIEDLHWADGSTVLMVGAIARRLTDVPLAMLVSLRPEPRTPNLDRLVELLLSKGGVHVPLTPLTQEAVHGIAEAAVGASIGVHLGAQLDGARGNPLFVLELLRALSEDGAITIEGGIAETRPSSLPSSLRLTLLRRVSSLAPATLEMLRAASILGANFEFAHLRAFLDRSEVDLLPSLDQATRAGLLTGTAGRLAFRHDLMRSAIYEDLLPAVRSAMHSTAAHALAGQGALAIDVAEQFALAGAAPAREARDWILRAARETAEREPGATVRLLDHLIEAMDPADAKKDAVEAEKSIALIWSGHLAEAERLTREILARPHDPDVETSLRLALIGSLTAQGRLAEAAVERFAALEAAHVPSGVRAQLRGMIAIVLLFVGQHDAARDAAEEARVEGEGAGDDLARCIAACALASIEQARARPAAAVSHATEAVARAARGEAMARRFPNNYALGLALIECDRFDEAEKAFRAGQASSEGSGAVYSLPQYQWGLLLLRFLWGRWDDAIADWETGLTLVEETGTRFGIWLGFPPRAAISAHRGDEVKARELLASAETELTASGVSSRKHRVLVARAALEEWVNGPERARSTLRDAWDACAAVEAIGDYPMVGPDLVRLWYEVDQPFARSVLSEIELVAEQIGSPTASAVALRSRGLLENEPSTMRRAVEIVRHSPRPFEQARTYEDAAVILGPAGEPAEASSLLEQARSIYAGLGALHHEARVLAGLRGLGVRPGQRGTRKRPTTGWESLTETEHKVARHIADGLTYREAAERLFVSPRTIETHVSHVLRKLGCTSRRELRQAFADRR